MTAEIVRDKTVDWLERFLDSRGFDLACRAIIALAALYFLPAVVRIMTER